MTVSDSTADALSPRIANLNDFEELARQCLPQAHFDYLAGGVGNEVTLRANLAAWDRIQIRSRVLVDVSGLDTAVTLFGQQLPHPILFAPTAYHKLFHPRGELETAQGAAASGTTLIASSFSSFTIEEIAGAAPASLWFQLYVVEDRDFTRRLVERSEAAGCKALVVTGDQPARGYRDRDIRNGFALPPGVERANLRGLNETICKQLITNQAIFGASHDPSFSWSGLEWFRSITKLPVVVKGIMTHEDARIALENGVDGLIVSNHGGRSVDTLPPTAEILPEVIDAVAGRCPVLVDGGIRRGTDVLKAIAMGASAVLIGRPYVYALAAGGRESISRLMDILTKELKMALAMSGRPSTAGLDPTAIRIPRT